MNLQIIRKDVIHINIKVRPNCDVILTAPLKTNDEYINYVLKKRANWINKKIDFYISCGTETSPPKEYVSGENVNYLGRNYRLKVREDEKETVKLQKGYINLFVKNKHNFDNKKLLIREWYYKKAIIHFNKALIKYQKIVNIEIKNIKIRDMKTRWGSCNPKKSYLNLNRELIKKPRECIEYVIFHELTHLIHSTHSKDFYNYLSIYMPDWKRRKNRLEGKS